MFQDEAVHQAGQGEIVIAGVNRVLRYHDTCQSGDYGILCVTNFRIVFVNADCSELPAISPRHITNSPDIPLTTVRKLYAAVRGPNSNSVFTRSKIALTSNVKVVNLDFIEIACKNFEVHRFGVQYADRNSLKKLITTLRHHCFPISQPVLFAFDYHPSIESERPQDEFSYSDIRANRQRTLEGEMRRCKADTDGQWTIAQNLQFAICHSYPALIVIPSAVSDEVLVRCKTSWEGGRFPIWSWSHPTRKQWLVRSSKRLSESDESKAFLRALQNLSGGKLEMVDADGLLAAKIQSSYEKLVELCYHERSVDGEKMLDMESSWLGLFEDTKWPKLLSRAIAMASNAATKLLAGVSLVVQGNCPDHSECLIVSLAMVMLDPYYRTRNGLQVLIEKEWASAGFRFLDGHIEGRGKGSDKNAMFLLFLDALHQMIVQYPLHFEFTETFLIHLWNTVLSCLYGDFVFNCDKERVPPEYTKTNSFWHHDSQYDTHDPVDAKNQNISFQPYPGPLLIQSSGLHLRPWVRCFYPMMDAVLEAEEQTYRQKIDEKLKIQSKLLDQKQMLMDQLLGKNSANQDVGNSGSDDQTVLVADGVPIPASVTAV